MTEKRTPRTGKVMPKIKAMKVGDVISFPIEWMDTVRVQASRCNLLHGGRRRTHVEAAERLIYVERSE